MEKNKNANDVVVEQTSPTAEEPAAESPKGILYETIRALRGERRHNSDCAVLDFASGHPLERQNHSLHRRRYGFGHVYRNDRRALRFYSLELHFQSQVYLQRRGQRTKGDDFGVFVLRSLLSLPDLVRSHD